MSTESKKPTLGEVGSKHSYYEEHYNVTTCKDSYKFPYFLTIKDNKAERFIGFSEINNLVTSGNLKGFTKDNLPAVIYSISNDNRKAILKQSDIIRTPYLGIDIDHCKPKEIITTLQAGVIKPIFTHTTTSGDGVRGVYRISEEVLHRYSHEKVWQSIANYLITIGVEVDAKTKDIKRLFFLNYDPTAIYNPDAGVVDVGFIEMYNTVVEPHPPIKDIIGVVSHSKTYTSSEVEDKVKHLYNRLLNPFEDTFLDGERNSKTNLLAKDCKEAGLVLDEVLQIAVDLIASSGYTDSEIEAVFRCVYNTETIQPTLKFRYARIGGVYFRINEDSSLSKWSKQEVKQDLGKGWESQVLILDGGFANVPNNINHNYVVDNKWNLSRAPLRYEVKTNHCNTILKYLEHLTKLSWKIDYLLDYLQIAYCRPTQKLPVLVLTSKLQGTGKSTFFNLLNWIFGDNTFVGSIEDISGTFTASWSNSQFIALEESTTDRKAQNDRIKHLATAMQIKHEPKGVDPTMVSFFAKIVIANNAEDCPVYIQATDQRYCVLRVPPLEVFNSNFERDCKNELGYFINWLATERQLTTQCESRLWFSQSIIETIHTQSAKESARPMAEVVVEEAITSILEVHPDVEVVGLRLQDIKDFMIYRGYECKQPELTAALRRIGVRKSRRNPKVIKWEFDTWVIQTLTNSWYIYEIKVK